MSKFAWIDVYENGLQATLFRPTTIWIFVPTLRKPKQILKKLTFFCCYFKKQHLFFFFTQKKLYLTRKHFISGIVLPDDQNYLATKFLNINSK